MPDKNFFADVYEVVKLIPPGRVTSYGAIARYLGLKSSARMVGWALNNSIANGENIPAHRVVNRNGLLTGKHHFGDSERMASLLRAEGVEIEKDRVTRFDELFWNPLKELL